MDSLRRVAVIVFLLTTLIFNALANIIPFNGLTTGGVSDGIPSLFGLFDGFFQRFVRCCVGGGFCALIVRCPPCIRLGRIPCLLRGFIHSTFFFFFHVFSEPLQNLVQNAADFACIY